MQPEKVFVVRARGVKKTNCITPHEVARREVARGLCQSCLNEAYARIESGVTDETLVAIGFWRAKSPSISDYVDGLLKKEA